MSEVSGHVSQPLRFERQLFSRLMLRPPDFASRRTSQLLSSGLVVTLPYNGIPIYTPLGLGLLERVEQAICAEGEAAGFSRVQIPTVMADRDLEGGERVGEIFASKMTSLSGDLAGFHILTSPEMLFARLLVPGSISHKSLPVRHGYTTTLLRQMPTVRGFVTAREFRIYGAISIDADARETLDALDEMIDLTRRVLGRWDVRLEMKRRPDGHFEMGYATDEGDMRIEGSKSLSMAIGFPYAPDVELPLPYRDAGNTDRVATMATYAAGLHRIVYAVLDRWRDDHGFALPPTIRPADVVIVPKLARGLDDAETLQAAMSRAGRRVAIDDRVALASAPRVAFAEYIGAPAAVLVDKGRCSVVLRASGRAVRTDLDAGAVDELMTAGRG